MLSITNDKSSIDKVKLIAFLQKESYWAQSRSLEQIETSIANSLCYVVLLDDKMIGFARVISDFGVFAYLADVFIDKDHRGKGYAKALMTQIFSDPKLKLISRWMLGTMDAHGLYRSYGFSEVADPKRWMEYLPKGNEIR
jgi:GNAT superfamily N-acetyltransferase